MSVLEEANYLLDKCENDGIESVDDLVGIMKLSLKLNELNNDSTKNYLDRSHSLLDGVIGNFPSINSYDDLSKIMVMCVELTTH